MATKKQPESNEKKSWQRSVAHVVEAALEDAGGRGASVESLAAKTGLPAAKIQRHVDYMCNELDGFAIKNQRATHDKRGVYKLVSVGHFRGDNALDIARTLFVGAKKTAKRGAKKTAKKTAKK